MIKGSEVSDELKGNVQHKRGPLRSAPRNRNREGDFSRETGNLCFYVKLSYFSTLVANQKILTPCLQNQAQPQGRVSSEASSLRPENSGKVFR